MDPRERVLHAAQAVLEDSQGNVHQYAEQALRLIADNRDGIPIAVEALRIRNALHESTAGWTPHGSPPKALYTALYALHRSCGMELAHSSNESARYVLFLDDHGLLKDALALGVPEFRKNRRIDVGEACRQVEQTGNTDQRAFVAGTLRTIATATVTDLPELAAATEVTWQQCDAAAREAFHGGNEAPYRALTQLRKALHAMLASIARQPFDLEERCLLPLAANHVLE